MKASANSKFSCKVFLKDKADIKLLKPKTQLYGQIEKSTGSIFMTPYKPPYDCMPWIGIVNPNKGHQSEIPLLMNVYIDNKSISLAGFIGKQHLEMPAEIIYKSAAYARTPFHKEDMKTLWNKTVLIFGAGTGGSKIALELVRAGVGKIIMIDFDHLDFANISRHEGDLFDVGKPKVQVVTERIYRINPAAKVEIYTENIFEHSFDEILSIFKKADAVVAATDKTAPQLQINEFTHRLKIPCIFGGCYESALGGEVFYTLPDKKMPCLACLRGGMKQPEQKSKIDYSTARGPQDYQGQPGLHAAVDFITCIEVQICLAILLRESKTSKLATMLNPKSNFLLIGGAMAQGFYRFRKPFDIFYQPLSGSKKNCIVCGNFNPEELST